MTKPRPAGLAGRVEPEAGENKTMKYYITAYSGGNGNGEAVCVIDAENPQQALMTCDGIDYANES